jgi:hypothetical protein
MCVYEQEEEEMKEWGGGMHSAAIYNPHTLAHTHTHISEEQTQATYYYQLKSI